MEMVEPSRRYESFSYSNLPSLLWSTRFLVGAGMPVRRRLIRWSPRREIEISLGYGA